MARRPAPAPDPTRAGPPEPPHGGPVIEALATAVFGVESEVDYEVGKLGYRKREIEDGHVRFETDLLGLARACLWLRTAERVCWLVGRFPARTFEELFQGLRAIPWRDILSDDASFPVDGNSVKSVLTSVPAVQRVAKKAIAETLAPGGRAPETGPEHRIRISLLRDEASVTLDACGDGLHARGYRPLTVEAPLKETLAAAMIQMSRWRSFRPFADPCCGSGTFAIEAALMGRNMAPGLQRTFAAEGWPVMDEALWVQARQEARDLERPPAEPMVIVGSDLSADAVSVARYHAKRAGVTKDVRFEVGDVAAFHPPGEYGCVVTNPPYGERQGEEAEVEALYRALGESMRRAPTWSTYVLTSHPNFSKLYGAWPSRSRKLYNGRLRCDLYEFHGPKPPRAPVKE